MNRPALAVVAFWFVFVSASFAQYGEREAARAGFDRAEASLNACYQKLLKAIPDEKLRQEVKLAQQAWVKFRDADASAHAGITSQGGSAYAMDFMVNLAELTEQRTAQLKKMLKFYSP